jgi:sporulation protein YtfJ
MIDKHPIQSLMSTTMENIKDMVDVNTVVGDPVQTSDGTTIIPISRVSFGFLSGGGEYNNTRNGSANRADDFGEETNSAYSGGGEMPFAGGTGAGVSVHPMGFLVVGNGNIKMLPTNYATPIDRVMELLPQVIGELKDVFQDGDESENNSTSYQKTFGSKAQASIPIETTKPIYDSTSGIYSSKNDPIAEYSKPFTDGTYKNQTKPESVVYTSTQTTAAPSSSFGGSAFSGARVNQTGVTGSPVYENKITGEKIGNKFDAKFDAKLDNNGEKKWTNATTGDDGATK